MPWGRLTKRMVPVTIVYFCYGWTLWLYLSWIPSFFAQSHGLNLKSSALFSAGVFFAGVVGDTLGAGDTRYYVAYYRDPQAATPCGSPAKTYNSTQGGRITWLP